MKSSKVHYAVDAEVPWRDYPLCQLGRLPLDPKKIEWLLVKDYCKVTCNNCKRVWGK